MSRGAEVCVGTLIVIAFVAFLLMTSLRSPYLARNFRTDLDALQKRIELLEQRKTK